MVWGASRGCSLSFQGQSARAFQPVPSVSYGWARILLRLLFLLCLESLMLSYQTIRVKYIHLAKLQLEWGSASRAQGCHQLGFCGGCAPVPR